jgi:predicted nuclease with TOPRIM domain
MSDHARSRRAIHRVFGEELETGFADRLLRIRDRLDELREEWEGAAHAHRAELLERALDELDEALELTRERRSKLTRLERRLAARYQTVLARLREAERDQTGPSA